MLSASNTKLNLARTALVVTDPQVEFVSPPIPTGVRTLGRRFHATAVARESYLEECGDSEND